MRSLTASMLVAGLALASGAGRAADWGPWPDAVRKPSMPDPVPPTSPATLFGLAAIRGYQVLLSPLLGGGCQFAPSCSRFASACIARHGLIGGMWIGADRISRCHGFVDPGDYAAGPGGRLRDEPE